MVAVLPETAARDIGQQSVAKIGAENTSATKKLLKERNAHMDDWHKRYEAASKEYDEASLEWRLAEQALARANAKLSEANRKFMVVYQERMKQVNG